MTPISGPLLPLLALVAPLCIGLLAAVPAVRPHAIRLLPFAPLTGLVCALMSPRDVETSVPNLLLGLRLGLDAPSALLLGMASFLWLMAGIYAMGYFRDTPKPAVFAGFWCLTLAGNLGVFLARDVASFYLSFAAVSLSAYVLVVHDGSKRALRAGRVYIILAVIGEASLLLGFLLGAAAADSLLIADIRAALASSPMRHIALTGLVIGFGIKAGLVPLHVWLPLAHPAAPTPASAVLSGAIVKAGIFGLIAFLPHGTLVATWGYGLAAIGLGSAYYAVLVGLTQDNPKTVLAYSTISQMGLVVAVIGAGMATDDPGPAILAACLYAAHHGLAKGALFMSVGLGASTGLGIGVAVVAALSVAGFPLTGGALAKGAIKGPLDVGTAAALLTLSAIGTALLLTRFLLLMMRQGPREAQARPKALLVGPFMACAAAALILPWLIFPAYSGLDRGTVVSGAALWGATWPLALAGLIAGVAFGIRAQLPQIPEGDVVVPLERMAHALIHGNRRSKHLHEVAIDGDLPLRTVATWAARMEGGLTRWSLAGLLLLGLVISVGVGLVW